MFNFVRFYEEKIIIDKCLQAYVLSIMNKVLNCMLKPKYIYRNHKYLARILLSKLTSDACTLLLF